MSRPAIKRQVIVTWETEKPPKPYVIVPVTVSMKAGHVTYDHAVIIADWDEEDGWFFYDDLARQYSNMVTVHAWADLEPYAGGNVDGGEVKYEHG